MQICKHFCLVFIALFLFISAFAFSQVKVNIEIEGNGVVCVQNSSFDGPGRYEYEDADFYWGRNTALVFHIKPGKQCYLDGIWVSHPESDSTIQIPKSAIYAFVAFFESSESDFSYIPDGDKCELCYDAPEEEKFATYHFVFRDVKPWDGTLSRPYMYDRAKVFLAYTPEEFIYACTQSFDYDQNLSNYVIKTNLQNDIDLNGKEISSYNGRRMVLFGNNKTIKNCYGQKNKELLSNVYFIHQLHVLSGDVSLFSIYNYSSRLVPRTIKGCTSNIDIVRPDGCTFNNLTDTNSCILSDEPVFFFRDDIYEESGNCINFGDNAISHSFFKRKTHWGNVYRESTPVKNLINWGSSKVVSFPNDSLGCFEMDKWTQPLNFFNYGKVERFWSLDKTDEECLLHNNSTFGSKAFGWAKDSAGYYNISNNKLTDSAFMRNLMGDSAEVDFVFEDGFYPRLRHMDERPGRLAASPILLAQGESADDVKEPFYVDTNYGVRWVSLSPGLVEIVGDSGYVRMPVAKDSVVRIEAWKEDFSKHVYLTIRARNFINKDIGYDTVCPGDSVWMVNSYARNEGWSYDVVWGEGNDASPDTVYRLYLHHYPAYSDTLYFLAERDSLPYVYGEDTIRNFGLTELRRYPTVHGCDSILYVQLDTLYVHRERHFRDSLHTCAGDTLYWRGKQITQTGNYTDTVFDPYRGGTDSVYHLRAVIYPTFHTIHTDSCYIEELPYDMDGRRVPDFGDYTDRHVTASGCDSVHEYSLSRRWHHYRVQVKVRGNGMANLTDTTVREDGKVRLMFTAATCHVLDSLRIDGRPVAPNTSCLLENLCGDCLVEAVFSESAPAESVLRYEVCTDSLPVRYNGEAYGAGEHEIRFTDAAGCDSIVRLNVREKRNAARIAVVDTIAPPCGANTIPVSYRVETGSPQRLLFRYDAAAHGAGFRDTVLEIRGGGERKTALPLPPAARPDRYTVQLWQADATGCYAQDETLTFEIPYPSSIIVQKWNDMLAVLSPEYNGAHEFSAYQWYADGEPIAGETGPYLYRKPYLPSTSRYSVLLERIADGLRLMSCPVKRQAYPRELALELRPNPAGQGSEVEVRVGGRPEAEGTIEVFDNTGRPVYSRPFLNGVHTLKATWQPGTYVVRVRGGKPAWTASGKLLVL